MAKFVNTIDILGDDAVIDSIIDGTITEFKDDYVTTVGQFAFANCTKLAIVDFPVVTSFDANAFENCVALEIVILRSTETMCALERLGLSNSGISAGTGYIYVPRALLSDDDATKDYRRATNWSTFAAQFRALEDYTVDGTITGELDETKIAT